MGKMEMQRKAKDFFYLSGRPWPKPISSSSLLLLLFVFSFGLHLLGRNSLATGYEWVGQRRKEERWRGKKEEWRRREREGKKGKEIKWKGEGAAGACVNKVEGEKERK
jgi:hypothetical protein